MKPAIFILVVIFLLGSGATIHPFPLIDAAEKGQTEKVKALLEEGADVNAKAKNGITALMWASACGRTVTVHVLLDAGADVTAKDKYGRTALMIAADFGKSEIVVILKNAEAEE